MDEREGGNLREVLSAVQDMIAKGESPDESNDAMECLISSYGRALNGSPCPCGSGAKYSECCKREYQAAVRGVKGLERERDDGPAEEPSPAEGGAEEPEQDVRWCCRVGVDRRTGEPVTDVSGTEMDDPSIPPQRIAGVLLAAYHDLMMNGTFMMANAVYNRVMGELGAAQARGRRGRRPPGRPVR